MDEKFIQKPHRWNIAAIRDFMIYMGPLSSVYDFLTFFILLKVFHSSEQLFHTGWFVESLATQTLVIFSIRTPGNAWRSKPSPALTVTALLVVILATILPYTPLSSVLGFTPMPAAFLLFLVIATVTYLALVEVVKRKLMPRLLSQGFG